MKSKLFAIAAAATLIGSIRMVMADALPPALAGTFVACIDRFQNQRNVPATEPCKPGETRTPLTRQTDQSDHSNVSLAPLQGTDHYAHQASSRGRGDVVGHGADGGGLIVVSDGVNTIASMSSTAHAISVYKGSLAAVSMKASDNGGEMSVYSSNGTPVAHMSVTDVAGGALVVARSDGLGIFEAQAEANGGGSACVNRRSNGGSDGRWCLGTALPLR